MMKNLGLGLGIAARSWSDIFIKDVEKKVATILRGWVCTQQCFQPSCPVEKALLETCN
jgi:hypothetical protein